ncbi:c-type cytochrome biogenesis protein CcsB [Actinorhabdospora filicis]|uniref:C-type cytochrome biogenesis protein CcsB n=1 Tax=Actinorhabdospora filicis TaxID=1785913 RepID=A0A9W6SIY3_9ACTN|nr:c-type cytochrome biogenesis protein CcsB [Actinorhabdospora filicis]GLZ77118.1 c-type cytochrome biogenesis protein CcsB [Actinorhabdospora filicis]
MGDVNATYASLSDKLFIATIVLYAVAMLGYALEYAFGRRAVKAEAKVLAGAGGPDVTEEETAGGHVNERAERLGITMNQANRAGQVALVLTWIGAVLHAACLVLRAVSVGRVPWGNMYEFIIAVVLVGVCTWLYVVTAGHAARRIGLFVTLVAILLLGTATRLYTEAQPLVPALNSYWIAIHVTAAVIASGIFMVGFVPAALQLIRRRYDTVTAKGGRLRFPITLGARLPEVANLERLVFKLHVFAFPLWTFGVIAGAVWAERAWGRYWGWDPKEVWSFIAWVVYAGYLHARATGPGGRRLAPWIVILGWLTMIVNLFGINLVVTGLHSYAGV